jgi:hypothetical protein
MYRPLLNATDQKDQEDCDQKEDHSSVGRPPARPAHQSASPQEQNKATRDTASQPHYHFGDDAYDRSSSMRMTSVMTTAVFQQELPVLSLIAEVVPNQIQRVEHEPDH